MISRPDFEKKQIVFVFANEGEKLSFSNDNLIVKDAEGKIKHQSTCYRLFLLFVVGNITITSGLIQRAKKFNFTICLMNRNMRLYEIIGDDLLGNTLLRRKQYSYKGLDIGKQIICNKINNQKESLKRIRYRPESTNKAIADLTDYSNRIRENDYDLHELLGIEGLSARTYFKEMYLDYDWLGRKPRIKNDYINSTLDIGYNILFNTIDAILGTFGFDTYYGVLHTCFYMRKSLVCDIVEPFRPLIDCQVRKSLNYGQIVIDDFEKYNNRYVLKWKKSPKYVSILAKPIVDNKNEIFVYIQEFYRSMMKEKPGEEYPLFIMR